MHNWKIENSDKLIKSPDREMQLKAFCIDQLQLQ